MGYMHGTIIELELDIMEPMGIEPPDMGTIDSHIGIIIIMPML